MVRMEIIDGIRAYAQAYASFQQLQDDHPDYLPVGDQKTGVVGEFFGLLYARSIYPSAQVTYSTNPSETGWDLNVSGDNAVQDLTIQVKAVSRYSKTRAISPVFPGWDHLYLVYLGYDLMPEGFWVVSDSNIFRGRPSLTALRMRDPREPQSGSRLIPWGADRVAELKNLLG